jgi:hypothetical protein
MTPEGMNKCLRVSCALPCVSHSDNLFCHAQFYENQQSVPFNSGLARTPSISPFPIPSHMYNALCCRLATRHVVPCLRMQAMGQNLGLEKELAEELSFALAAICQDHVRAAVAFARTSTDSLLFVLFSVSI